MKKSTVILFVLFSSLIWGSLYAMVKIGYQYCGVLTTMDSLVFAGVRFLIVGSTLCLMRCIRNRGEFSPVKDNVKSVFLVSFYGIILSYSFTYIGLMLTDSSKSAVLKQIGMLFYICFSSFFFKNDHPTVKKTIAGLMGFLGIVIMNLDNTGFHFKIGDLLLIGASFSAVLNNVTGKKVYQKVNPIVVNGIATSIGGIVLLSVGLLGGGSIHFQRPWGYLSLLYICFASVLADCFWAYAVKYGNISELYILKFIEPGFAAICGALLLGEDIFRWQFVVAFLLIIFGIYISQNTRKHKEKNYV